MLRASVIGNLGGDPEIRYSQRGEQIVTISVAVNQRKRVPGSEEWKESTEWFRVRCTGWRAELAQKLGKGQRVFVCGRLEINEFQRRDGSPGVAYDIWADELHGMSAAARGEVANGAGQATAPQSPAAAGGRARLPEAADDDEELPF
jgi:single-strand DNA-binding protein